MPEAAEALVQQLTHRTRAQALAELIGLTTVAAPVDAANYSLDVDALCRLAHQVKPSLITAELADEVAALRSPFNGVHYVT